MATAAERLVALAGASGAAGALLLAIGAGATAGAALVAYSGLGAASAATHLLTDRAAPDTGSGGHAVGGWPWAVRPYRPKEEDEALLLMGLV